MTPSWPAASTEQHAPSELLDPANATGSAGGEDEVIDRAPRGARVTQPRSDTRP